MYSVLSMLVHFFSFFSSQPLISFKNNNNNNNKTMVVYDGVFEINGQSSFPAVIKSASWMSYRVDVDFMQIANANSSKPFAN